MTRFIHPEIRDILILEKFTLHFANKHSFTASQLDSVARQAVWDRCMKHTKEFLAEIRFCPRPYPPVEELERQLQMDEVLDEELNDDEI